MSFLWTITFMAIVGAAIGAVTNHLAIQMLFRPHEAKYIGSLEFLLHQASYRKDVMSLQNN